MIHQNLKQTKLFNLKAKTGKTVISLPGFCFLVNNRLVVAASHKYLQNIPEQKRDAGEKRKRSGDVLVCIIAVENIRRIIKNRAAGKSDHYEGENISQTKAENDARNDKAESEKTADHQYRTEKREVLFSQKNDRRQTEK